MKNCTLILLVYLFCPLSAFNQWDKLRPTMTNNHLNSVFFTDSTHGWIVGDDGIIVKYDGVKWSPQVKVPYGDLLSVFFLDPEHGWAAGKKGTILRYNGDHWTRETFGAATSIYQVFFTDQEHGWAIGDGCTVYKFNGSQWQLEYKDIYSDTDLKSIFLLDAHTGWAVGKYRVLKYNGTQWSPQGQPLAYDLVSVYFTSPDFGWAVGTEYFGSQTDRKGVILKYDGISWTPVPFNLTDYPVKVFFTYPNNGWILTQNGSILKYENNQWNEQQHIKGHASDIFYTDPNTGWAVGDSGLVLKFDGYNWTSLCMCDGTNNNYDFNTIRFDRNGFGGVTGNGRDSNGVPAAAFFGGEAWNKLYEEHRQHFNSFDFTPGGVYIAGGYSDKSFLVNMNYTTGQVTHIDPGTNSELFSICLHKNAGWAGGSHGTMLQLDSITWTSNNVGMDEDIYSLFCLDLNNVWAVGNRYNGGSPSSEIFKFNGNHWTSIYSGQTQVKINSLFFTDSLNGWAVGSYAGTTSVVLRTADGGINWNMTNLGSTTALNSIYCADSNKCYVVGTQGRIVKYDGTSWMQEWGETDKDLNCVVFVDHDGWYAAGNAGTILYKAEAGITGVDEIKRDDNPVISCIFPNPFDNEATITYSIEHKGPVRLSIYDISGKQVMELVNGIRAKGLYSCKITGDHMNAGVYVYRFQTAGKTENGKIVKL